MSLAGKGLTSHCLSCSLAHYFMIYMSLAGKGLTSHCL